MFKYFTKKNIQIMYTLKKKYIHYTKCPMDYI